MDRGFRDFATKHKDHFNILMPAFLDKEKQLSTRKANKSRFCTKGRHVVERVFGRLQQIYPYIAKPVSNRSLIKDHDYRDFKNICALFNEFHSCLDSDSGKEEMISQQIKSMISVHNDLADLVNGQNLNSKKSFFDDAMSLSMSESIGIDFSIIEIGQE